MVLLAVLALGAACWVIASGDRSDRVTRMIYARRGDARPSTRIAAATRVPTRATRRPARCQASGRDVLARQDAKQREVIEDTFGGLRFVRNQMGYNTEPADIIRPLDSCPGADAPRIAAWTWRSLPEPAPASPAGQAWVLSRYRAYQQQLAGRRIGDTFNQAVTFLSLAAGDSSPSRA